VTRTRDLRIMNANDILRKQRLMNIVYLKIPKY